MDKDAGFFDDLSDTLSGAWETVKEKAEEWIGDEEKASPTAEKPAEKPATPATPAAEITNQPEQKPEQKQQVTLEQRWQKYLGVTAEQLPAAIQALEKKLAERIKNQNVIGLIWQNGKINPQVPPEEYAAGIKLLDEAAVKKSAHARLEDIGPPDEEQKDTAIQHAIQPLYPTSDPPLLETQIPWESQQTGRLAQTPPQHMPHIMLACPNCGFEGDSRNIWDPQEPCARCGYEAQKAQSMTIDDRIVALAGLLKESYKKKFQERKREEAKEEQQPQEEQKEWGSIPTWEEQWEAYMAEPEPKKPEPKSESTAPQFELPPKADKPKQPNYDVSTDLSRRIFEHDKTMFGTMFSFALGQPREGVTKEANFYIRIKLVNNDQVDLETFSKGKPWTIPLFEEIYEPGKGVYKNVYVYDLLKVMGRLLHVYGSEDIKFMGDWHPVSYVKNILLKKEPTKAQPGSAMDCLQQLTHETGSGWYKDIITNNKDIRIQLRGDAEIAADNRTFDTFALYSSSQNKEFKIEDVENMLGLPLTYYVDKYTPSHCANIPIELVEQVIEKTGWTGFLATYTSRIDRLIKLAYKKKWQEEQKQKESEEEQHIPEASIPTWEEQWQEYMSEPESEPEQKPAIQTTSKYRELANKIVNIAKTSGAYYAVTMGIGQMSDVYELYFARDNQPNKFKAFYVSQYGRPAIPQFEGIYDKDHYSVYSGIYKDDLESVLAEYLERMDWLLFPPITGSTEWVKLDSLMGDQNKHSIFDRLVSSAGGGIYRSAKLIFGIASIGTYVVIDLESSSTDISSVLTSNKLNVSIYDVPDDVKAERLNPIVLIQLLPPELSNYKLTWGPESDIRYVGVNAEDAAKFVTRIFEMATSVVSPSGPVTKSEFLSDSNAATYYNLAKRILEANFEKTGISGRTDFIAKQANGRSKHLIYFTQPKYGKPTNRVVLYDWNIEKEDVYKTAEEIWDYNRVINFCSEQLGWADTIRMLEGAEGIDYTVPELYEKFGLHS